MNKAQIEARIIRLAREFAGMEIFRPTERLGDLAYACVLRGRFKSLVAHLDEITKGKKA
jgi:hypothetical protein